MFVQKRINNLKRWKAQALTHMELIFTRLKEAVPLTSFEEVQQNYQEEKQRNAQLSDRNIRLIDNLNFYKSKERKYLVAEDKIEDLYEEIGDLQDEYDVLKTRLEAKDQSFKWENGIFQKIADKLNRLRISPL